MLCLSLCQKGVYKMSSIANRLTTKKFLCLAAIATIAMVLQLIVSVSVILHWREDSSRDTLVLGLMDQKEFVDFEVLSVKNVTLDDAVDMKRVTASVKISNKTRSEVQISPGMQIHLMTQAGTSYPMTAEFLSIGESIGGPIQPASGMIMDVDFIIHNFEKPKFCTFQLDSSSEMISRRM